MSSASMRVAGVILVAVVLVLTAKTIGKYREKKAGLDQTLCAGQALRSVQARNDAMEAGYQINGIYDCISRGSFDEVNRQKAAWDQAQKAPKPVAASAAEPERTLAQARQGFKTAIAGAAPGTPLPQPPAQLFVRTDYRSTQNLVLPAFVTPNPKDGRKHPAIVWLTGGDSSSLDDFWTPGPETNDQSASAFRKAGVVMMFPTLRGGHNNPGGKEYFLGEVDDVLAAADHLASLPYVDPARIYLGGHSTGGTLVLLAAQTGKRFSGVFAFGPVTTIDGYPRSLVPVDFSRQEPLELKLRSPIHWLNGIASPTYVIEGRDGNFSELEKLCARSSNALLHCIRVEDADHFSVLAKVNRVIAARLAVSAPGMEFRLDPEEFLRKSR